MVLGALALKAIHRSHYRDYDDVFALARSARCDFVERTLSAIIRRVRENGSLAQLYRPVHQPYANWQLGRGNKKAA